jgi:hypothetical protein
MKGHLQTNLRLSLLSLAVLICLGSFAQTKKVPFNTSTIEPGAEGTVKVKKDKNGNYNIDISIDNLADPKRLTPAKKAMLCGWKRRRKASKTSGRYIAPVPYFQNQEGVNNNSKPP